LQSMIFGFKELFFRLNALLMANFQVGLLQLALLWSTKKSKPSSRAKLELHSSKNPRIIKITIIGGYEENHKL